MGGMQSSSNVGGLNPVGRRWRQAGLSLLAASALASSAMAVAQTPPTPGLSACNRSGDGSHSLTLQPVAPDMVGLRAAAAWLDDRLLRWGGLKSAGAGLRYRLLHARQAGIVAAPGQYAHGHDGAVPLLLHDKPLPGALAQAWRWFPEGPVLAVPTTVQRRLHALHQAQLVLVQEDEQGRVTQATRVQHARALDVLFSKAQRETTLGAHVLRGGRGTRFKLWAPTAQAVALCLYPDGASGAEKVLSLQPDPATGIWSLRLAQDWSGHYYTYLVDVVAPGVGLVKNRVTDPYSLSLSTDSQRSWIGRLDAPALKPPLWDRKVRTAPVESNTDLVIYELHVRDFSASDTSVPGAYRGKFTAFTQTQSQGMQHLRRLAEAGVTDVHLLPVFDLASVPERGCTTATVPANAAPDSPDQQAAVMAHSATDCFNWGYDPWHYTAPEGSYASDPADGAVRILEFRQMVQALHNAGLRVGMDVVYNHTSAAGQDSKSVLDRIVPGYYQRLNAQGTVENSTCCANTATEHAMMAKLMIDSVVIWARDHHIDSFRFDLMGHQPRDVMLRLQRAVDRAAGRHIALIGEGWNFGEVKDGARFVQASQHSLNGSGIGSFSDRGRDAARGGGCCDDAQQTVQRQGWVNGLYADPNGSLDPPATQADLMRAADLVRVGLAGTLRSYRMTTYEGRRKTLDSIDYAGQGAGFASQPGEVVNYVENHDNQTLFDINTLKLPVATSAEDRARVQVLGLALTAFSQGAAYFHAGGELLRSKSGDRNSYDSGDWFNRLDWSASTNFWGTGLPPQQDNQALWPALAPRLANAALKPAAQDIRFTRDAFLDLLRIRNSSRLFRLPTAAQVSKRLTLLNTGPDQVATLVAGHLNGQGLRGAGFAELMYFVNADRSDARVALPAQAGKAWALHPAHLAPDAADPRVVAGARWVPATGTVTVPARSAVVFVRRQR